MTVRFFGMRYIRLLYEQEPIERKLGQRIVSATRRSKRYIKRVWDYVYDVPHLSSLHQLLSDPFVLDEVQFAYWILLLRIISFLLMQHIGIEGTPSPKWVAFRLLWWRGLQMSPPLIFWYALTGNYGVLQWCWDWIIVHYPVCIERQVMNIVSFRNLRSRQRQLWDVLRGGWGSRFKKLRLWSSPKSVQ